MLSILLISPVGFHTQHSQKHSLNLAFVKGMTRNNLNMCNTLQHSFFVSMLRKTLFQSSKYVEFLLLFIRGTIKVFKTCQSSLITFKLQPFFDNKSLKWFVILIISLSPN